MRVKKVYFIFFYFVKSDKQNHSFFYDFEKKRIYFTPKKHVIILKLTIFEDFTGLRV